MFSLHRLTRCVSRLDLELQEMIHSAQPFAYHGIRLRSRAVMTSLVSLVELMNFRQEGYTMEAHGRPGIGWTAKESIELNHSMPERFGEHVRGRLVYVVLFDQIEHWLKPD